MKRFWRMVLVLLVGTGMVLGGFPAVYGQDSEEKEEEKEVFTLDEIVVTATKREENILDVPVTLSAFDSGLIEELGISDEGDLEALTPGLQFGNDESREGEGTVIRGIGTRAAGTLHADLAVANYVDGIYSHSAVGVAPNLFDIERVEVARGPQGTLHGRNSIAGSISYVTKKPTADWDAQILTEFTDQVTQRYNVAFGGPVYGPLMFRLTGGYYTGDGAQENIGLGDDYDAPDETYIAPQLRFKWNRFDVNVRYAVTEDTGVPRAIVALYDPPRDQPWACEAGANLPADMFRNLDESDLTLVDTGVYTTEINGVPVTCTGSADAPENWWYLYTEPSPAVADCGDTIANNCDDLENKVNFNRTGVSDTKRESWGANADIDIIDGLMLRYTYGESHTDQWTSRDRDFINATAPAVPGGRLADDRVIYPYTVDEHSHEVQLISNLGGKFEFILGYFNYEGNTLWGVSYDSFGNHWRDFDNSGCPAVFAGGWADYPGSPYRCASGADHLESLYYGTESFSETHAWFGHVDYNFNDQWAVSGGLRHTEDQKIRKTQYVYWSKWYDDYSFAAPVVMEYYSVAYPDAIQAADNSPTWDDIIWDVSLQYRPVEGTMVYGRISTGYRAGGFQDSSAYHEPIKKETLVNYEIGLKGLFLNQRLNIRSAAFYNTYEDYQIAALIDPGLSICGPGVPQPCLSENAESPLVEFIDNIPGTKIWGFELEASYYITEQLRVAGFYTYLGSDIGPFTSIVTGDPDAEMAPWTYVNADTGADVPGFYQKPEQWEGGTLPQQPEHKAAVTLAYENSFEKIPGTFLWSGTLSYRGEMYPQAQNIESQKMRAHKRLDLRASWTSPSGKWSASAYIQNVADEIGLVQYIPVYEASNPSYPPRGTLTDPRRMGIIVSWKM